MVYLPLTRRLRAYSRLGLALLGTTALFGLSACSRTGDTMANSEAEVAERIQKVGRVSLVAANAEPRTGEAVFQAQCSACHASGALGSPKFGDTNAWAPRLKSGFEALLGSALKGKGQMAPQGGGSASELEIARAVVYMANAAGGKFAEPPPPQAK